MEYRRSSLGLTPPLSPSAGITAHIYASFAGTPGHRNGIGLTDVLSQWWDDEQIESIMTREFVASKLQDDERERLDEAVRFGDGLTDKTYVEWIMERAKRIFLILVDLDVPDQIFGVIDDSWADDDLPIPLDQVQHLRLTLDKDVRLERRFFQRQFSYLLRYLQRGQHVTYSDLDIVPLELCGARASLDKSVDHVHLPGKPDQSFLRHRVALGTASGRHTSEDLMSAIDALRAVQHTHSTQIWASYVQSGSAYLLLTPVHETDLKTLLTTNPPSIRILPKHERRVLILNWLHCLSAALAHLHDKGQALGNVLPSNICLDLDNQIYLGPRRSCTVLGIDVARRVSDEECDEYAAPEALPAEAISSEATENETKPSSVISVRRKSIPFSITSDDPRASSYFTHFPDGSRQNSVSLSSSSLHDPQAADIFSLGAIFLELLGFLLKRTTRAFASHRAQRSRTRDSSFHANLEAVSSWSAALGKEASRKEDAVFRGIAPTLALTERMLALDPVERPSARRVQLTLDDILTRICGLDAPGQVHCHGAGFGCVLAGDGDNLEALRRASQRAAAAACRSVAGLSPLETADVALGNGGVIRGVETRAMVSDTATVTDGSRGKSQDDALKHTNRNSVLVRGTTVEERQGRRAKKTKAWQAPVYAGEC